jgi:hypothetical protein
MRPKVGFAFFLLLGLVGHAQVPGKPQYAPASQMPIERIPDSYAIYSQLLPSNAIEWSDVPRSQWLLESVTNAVPLGSPCTSDDMANPHNGIKPPAERKAEFDEVLADFDAHCHERFQLDGKELQSKLPIHLLSDEDRARYTRGVMGYMPPANDIMRAPATPDEFKGAAGLHRFTAVYFNKTHTLAMTEFGMYCGGLCGNWTWVVLERTPQGWRRLPWVSTMSFS